MDGYVRTALVVCIAATMLTAGTIAYALMKGEKEDLLDYGILNSFSDYDELADFLEDASFASNDSYYSLDDIESGASDAVSEGNSHSTTNVQVSGVDEQDTVKTDGKYIFAASYNAVTIIEAYPPSAMKQVSVLAAADVIPFKSDEMYVYISGIYVFENRLVVLSSVYMGWWYYYGNETVLGYPVDMQRTYVSVFDISDIATPELEACYGVSGYSLTSRMIDEAVYIVAQAYVWEIGDYPSVPRMWTWDEGQPFDPGLIYYDPATDSKNSYLNLLAVDVPSGEFKYMSIIAGYASTIYMSPDALYLTFQKGGVHITLVDDMMTPEVEDTTKTTIHRVSVSGLSMLPDARGDVKGWLLNQFSMDEKDGMLRIATTTSWDEPENGVYILNSTLSVVGSIEGLAPTERIFAARFLGDTLYLVTFLQIDPLFVIDLSDPTDPKVLGELELPGFSSYLHPVDDTHVLGIGRIDDHVKLSMFDVSDPAKPLEQDSFVVSESSWSTSGYDHKSVLFDLEKELLVIPMTTYNYSSTNGSTEYWSGVYVFRVSLEDGISLRGTIEHEGYLYYNNVERSLYIEDSLYTVSLTTLMANSLVDLSLEGSMVYNSDAIWWYGID